jgi:hypothetical protein
MAYASRMNGCLSEDDIEDLALQAQQRNIELGVTGVLFIAEDRFLQVLEGEHAAVAWLYQRIAADPRHDHFVDLLDQPLDARVFEGWTMRIMDEYDLPLEQRRLVMDSLYHAEDLDEIGSRLPPVEFAHCYAALAGSAPRPFHYPAQP